MEFNCDGYDGKPGRPQLAAALGPHVFILLRRALVLLAYKNHKKINDIPIYTGFMAIFSRQSPSWIYIFFDSYNLSLSEVLHAARNRGSKTDG